MVARVTTGKRLRGLLSYNENKVAEREARLLTAVGFGASARELDFNMKLKRLQGLASRNKIARTNAVHISLNFPPGEDLEAATFKAIAGRYMELIGFGQQPYLVYQHLDAAHPHIHIVTTNIQADGQRIPLHYIGRDKSNVARIIIEKEFDLIPASSRELKNHYVPPGNFEYGSQPTKNEISNRVRSAFEGYRYTSMSEYTTLLRLFGVAAIQGRPGSLMEQKRGLVYQGLGPNDQGVGRPIKASQIYNEPTIPEIEKKFEGNKKERKRFRARSQRVIDIALRDAPALQVFLDRLKDQGVDAVIARGQDGHAFGITFVDHKGKCVFKGSDLGKEYSLSAITDRLGDCSEENSMLLKILESSTDLQDKPGAVLRYWQCLGVGIRQGYEMGRQTFLMGRVGTPLSSYCRPSPLFIDFIQGQLTRAGSAQHNLLGEQKGIFAIMVDPVEEYFAQPGELLREARKKKRKLRRY